MNKNLRKTDLEAMQSLSYSRYLSNAYMLITAWAGTNCPSSVKVDLMMRKILAMHGESRGPTVCAVRIYATCRINEAKTVKWWHRTNKLPIIAAFN